VDREGLTSLDPPLFSMVVSSPEVACTSEELSKYVAEFARKHAREMNVELLDVVTDNRNMATIDPVEAVYLLQLAEEYDDKSDLGARCIKSCATAWHGTLVAHVEPSREDAAGSYVQISAPLKVLLLEKALIQAEGDCSQMEAKKADFCAKEKHHLRAKDEIIASKEMILSDISFSLGNQDELCRKLEAELATFHRLPNDYKFPALKGECTYHPRAAFEQRSLCGTCMPSRMPPNSTEQDKKGYICRILENDSMLPLYFYTDGSPHILPSSGTSSGALTIGPLMDSVVLVIWNRLSMGIRRRGRQRCNH